MNLRYLLVLALAGTCGVALPGYAAEPLRLDQAVSRALGANPLLVAEKAELRAAEARSARGALPKPLTIGGEFENFAGSGMLSGVRSSETTLRIGKVLELGGKRPAREALGRAEVDEQLNQADAVRVALVREATSRFIDVVADQERLAFARERVQLAERTRREVASWVNAARNPESDLRSAEIALAEAELELEDAQHELESARVTLAAIWGTLEPDFSDAVGDFDVLPELPQLAALAARLPLTPGQRHAALQRETADARRRVAMASAKPDIDLSLGVRRLEGLDDQGLVMSVSVPLGTRARAGHSVSEADAEIAAIDARMLSQRYERHQQLFAAYQELAHARHEVERLRTAMIPKAEEAVAITRRGFEQGRFAFLMLDQSQRKLFDLRIRQLEATARYHTLLAEIESLTATVQDTIP
ncbi:TolC family protein [Luteimonas terricola]|uniref:Cation efflux system protein n=1 Tax=Luteimonas terricola TaxID=645597 RepID=A0ABQ2EC81_9GAMM|nr:TolC family protein [Luteimonas terricola]GGK06289.1 cation efflux system protein [Luteimonas terricola]